MCENSFNERPDTRRSALASKLPLNLLIIFLSRQLCQLTNYIVELPLLNYRKSQTGIQLLQ